MINTMLPSFYILEMQGDIVQELFGEDFQISKISVASGIFDSDLEATQEGVAVAASLTSHLKRVKMSQEFNPDFFPNMDKVELTEQQQIEEWESNEEAETLSKKLSEVGQFAISIPKIFDELGDFIISRWKFNAPKSNVLVKIGVNPDEYVLSKYESKHEKTFGLATENFKIH